MDLQLRSFVIWSVFIIREGWFQALRLFNLLYCGNWSSLPILSGTALFFIRERNIRKPKKSIQRLTKSWKCSISIAAWFLSSLIVCKPKNFAYELWNDARCFFDWLEFPEVGLKYSQTMPKYLDMSLICLIMLTGWFCL